MKPFSNFAFFFALILYLVTHFTPGIALAINAGEHNLPQRPSGEAGDIFAPLDVLHAPRASADDAAEDTTASGYVHVSVPRSTDDFCASAHLIDIYHNITQSFQKLSTTSTLFYSFNLSNSNLSKNDTDAIRGELDSVNGALRDEIKNITDAVLQLSPDVVNAQNDTQTLAAMSKVVDVLASKLEPLLSILRRIEDQSPLESLVESLAYLQPAFLICSRPVNGVTNYGSLDNFFWDLARALRSTRVEVDTTHSGGVSEYIDLFSHSSKNAPTPAQPTFLDAMVAGLLTFPALALNTASEAGGGKAVITF